jgi:two-component system response regulator PilR (NtrC family)
MLDVCRDILTRLPGAELVTEASARRAADRVSREAFDLMVTDLRMPELDGLDLLRLARESDEHLPLIVFTAFPTVEAAVDAMKLGAADFLTKPFLPDELLRIALELLEERDARGQDGLLGRAVSNEPAFDGIVGQSLPMRRVFDAVSRVAEVAADVLICGETGTGKELVARSLHGRSERRQGRFVPVDCGAIPEDLLESEFFGHERGAFTGAHARSVGLLEFAHQGTFFLDEVAELSPRLQVKLLRVLQERRIRRVGGRDEIPVDLRVVAATSRDLEREIQAGRFREDLFYRINVARIRLPPLRERDGDVALLVEHFVARYSQELGSPAVSVDAEALDVLAGHPWPGNVRELQNAIKRSLALCRRQALTVDDLPEEILAGAGDRVAPQPGFFHARAQRVAAFEREYLEEALRVTGGDVARAAREACVPRGTIYRLLNKHGIHPERFRGGDGSAG